MSEGKIILNPNDVPVVAPVAPSQGIQGDIIPPDPQLNAQFKRDLKEAGQKAAQEEIQNTVKKDARLTVAQWMDINMDLIKPYYPHGTEFAFMAFHPTKQENALCITTATIEEVEKALQKIMAFKVAQQVQNQQ